MWLSFDSLDVWFFRDNRPFDAGDSTWGRSRFPPPPETLFGTVRALLLDDQWARKPNRGPDHLAWIRQSNFGRNLCDDEGNCVDLLSEQGIQLRGPFLVAAQGEGGPAALLPCPYDLLVDAESDYMTKREPRPIDAAHGLVWNDAAGLPAPVILHAEGSGLEEPKHAAWLTAEAFIGYLTGDPQVSAAKSEPASDSTRVGIAIQDGQVREGMIYRAVEKRPKATTRLVVELRSPAGPSQARWLRFGGEGHLAHIRPTDPAEEEGVPERSLAELLAAPPDKARTRIEQTGWLRVVTLTPAITGHGWLPGAVETSGAGAWRARGHPFALRGAAVGKPLAISGWDMKDNRPKPLRRAIPAGSVFYLEHIGDPATRAADVAAFAGAFHGNGAFCGGDAQTRRAGYGVAVVGACKPAVASPREG